jgi:large subunit ribosomal protein L22
MEIKASLNYLRIAPRKVRLVANLVRGMEVSKAKTMLQFTKQRAAKPILKLLNSALENAQKNFHLNQEMIQKFYIKKITVDEGPKLKRWMPVSRGTAHEIQKKTSHINLVLDEKPKQENKKILK